MFKNGDAPTSTIFELGQHGRNRSNVWHYARRQQFPHGPHGELAASDRQANRARTDAMRDCSRRGDIILDTFLGSGTPFMAAERIGRRGFGMEIDFLYVDVAIRRYQAPPNGMPASYQDATCAPQQMRSHSITSSARASNDGWHGEAEGLRDL